MTCLFGGCCFCTCCCTGTKHRWCRGFTGLALRMHEQKVIKWCSSKATTLAKLDTATSIECCAYTPPQRTLTHAFHVQCGGALFVACMRACVTSTTHRLCVQLLLRPRQ